MATDVARLSFDPARHYTGVVPQQGRVSLEAEQNEQRIIDAEERRRELLDIVGPAGTPDNGYAVSSPAPGALTVGAGHDVRRRVAGRARRAARRPAPARLAGPAAPGRGRHRRTGHVLLTLTERDVTAVEDPALYEVALGGPDGAARTRLLQHVERPRDPAGDLRVRAGRGRAGLGRTRPASSIRRRCSWRPSPGCWSPGRAPPRPADPCEPRPAAGTWARRTS